MQESLLRTDRDFEAFYTRNYKSVYRICFTYMKDSYEAEDCTEDTFVKVLTGNYMFNDENHEKAWLSVTAMNLCKDRLKHWWRRNTLSIEQCPETVDTAMENNFEIDETLDAVMKLPTKYKDVVYLYYYMGYQTDEISSMLKKNASTVRNHLREARLILKEQLGGEFN